MKKNKGFSTAETVIFVAIALIILGAIVFNFFPQALTRSLGGDITITLEPGKKLEDNQQGRFYAFEIKSSVEDFHSGHGTNWGIADMNYIVTLPEVYEKIKQALPHWVGCVIPYGNSMKVIKRAKQCDRDKSNSEMLLMMFRSANRENIRRRKREG